MFTLLFAVIWQFILFVIIVSAVCYIGYWGLVGLALIVYAPSLHSQSPRSWIATHCSHNSNPVGNQGSTTTSKSKLLIGQRGQFWQKCHFSPCPLHRYSIGRTLTVPIFRLVSLTAFLKRFNPERIDRWGGLLLRAAKVLVATRKGRIGPRSNTLSRSSVLD
jgi:hypothetical protein